MGLIRDSFVIFKNWADAINALPEEYQLETYKALVEYGISGTIKEGLSAVANAMLISFSVGMENSICRYSASVENGKKGGRPQKQSESVKTESEIETIQEPPKNLEKPNNNLEEPNNNLEKPSETKANLDEPTPNLNVNDNVNVNDNNSIKENTKEKNPPLTPKGGRDLLNDMISSSGLSVNVQNALMRWITYKKFAYKKVGFDSLLSIAQKKVSMFGEQAVIDLIDECMSNTYKGIIWDKLSKSGKQNQEVKQSAKKNYDYGADSWG